MVMDAPRSRPAPADTNVNVFVDFDSTDELEKSFEALAQGGTVTARPGYVPGVEVRYAARRLRDPVDAEPRAPKGMRR